MYLKNVTFLILSGLDTVAYIFLNENLIAYGTDNMFIPYTIPLDKENILAPLGEKNKLAIYFDSPVDSARQAHEKYIEDYGYDVKPNCSVQQTECHVNHIRKMQSSFG